MVRGITRQVVLVKSLAPALFESAIFLLREDALEKHGITERELLEEARQLANDYVASHQNKKHRRKLPPLLYMAAGAAPVALAWLFTFLI